MKILIINQHSHNHGDEAAGKALIRSLYEEGFRDIAVSYNLAKTDPESMFHYKTVRQISSVIRDRGSWRLAKWAMKYPHSIYRFLPRYRKDYWEIRKADYVISAPGGINMGLYRDYGYVWRLSEAVRLGKKVAIYSPSIGPFDTQDFFYNTSQNILRQVDFLSLRDKKSCDYADNLNVSYIASIDTAFLESPDSPLSEELQALLPEHYAVLVPNQLYTWHVRYKGTTDATQIDRFYEQLIDRFVQNGIRVVLLPQLFGNTNGSDEVYFNTLKKDNESVIVVPAKYDSDVQQKIIQNSSFVVGARYHTIVFAINNAVPFACLSYEHKIENMLETLDLQILNNRIDDAFANPASSIEHIWDLYVERERYTKSVDNARSVAKRMAVQTFDRLLECLHQAEN